MSHNVHFLVIYLKKFVFTHWKKVYVRVSINTYNWVHYFMAEYLRALSIFMIGNQNLLSSN